MTVKKETIKTIIPKNPMHCQAVRVGDLVFTAGQISIDPHTGAPVDGDVEIQTRRALDNLKLVLESAGTNLDNVAKTVVYLRNWDDFVGFNEVYVSYFPQDPPARTTTQAGRLGAHLLVEIEAVAAMP